MTTTAEQTKRWVSSKALNPDRKRSIDHPWNRGYPNNKILREMVKGKAK